jgi:hypothetical protein
MDREEGLPGETHGAENVDDGHTGHPRGEAGTLVMRMMPITRMRIVGTAIRTCGQSQPLC